MKYESFDSHCANLGMTLEEYEQTRELIKVDANIVYNMTRTYCVPGSGMYFKFDEAIASPQWASTLKEDIKAKITPEVYIEQLTKELKLLGMEFMTEDGEILFRVA